MLEHIPSAPEFERAVIGEMLIAPEEAIGPVVEAGGEELFYNQVYEKIFRVIYDLHVHGEGVDQLTVARRLTQTGDIDYVGGEIVIATLMNETGSVANIEYHLSVLREKTLLRKLIFACNRSISQSKENIAVPEEILECLTMELDRLRSFMTKRVVTVSDRIREWVQLNSGEFSSTDIYRDLNLSTLNEKSLCSKILHEFIEDGTIERHGKHRGSFRRIEGECERLYLTDSEANVLNFRWPGNVENLVEIMPGNVAVLAGEPNAGKTAYLLNVVRLNMGLHEIHYFTSEMGAGELRKRLQNFTGIKLNEWRFNAWERSANYADVIRPDAVNIIDYMEIHEDFYRLGGEIKAVFDRLKKGIAIIAIQKNLGTNIGRGGIATLEKPRLYLAMTPGTLTIVKGKNWASRNNPNGLSSRFRIINGARFEFDDWVRN